MSPDPPVVLRCATIVFRDAEILVVRRSTRGDWVLPGGRPRPREGVLACARREVREETGLDVDPGRCAFVLETISPSGEQRVIEVVVLSPDRPTAQPVGSEPGMEPEFVALSRLGELDLRPPTGRAHPGAAREPALFDGAVSGQPVAAGGQRVGAMMTGPTHYCWSCYSRVAVAGGRCPRCGGPIEAPPEADYADRLVWALDHPLAARVLGQRGEARAADRLYRLARSREDPYLAAAALQALVAITGRSACADLVAELAQRGPAPVRRTAGNLLDGDDEGAGDKGGDDPDRHVEGREIG